MVSFFQKKKTLALVLHIGSHSVAGAFVKYQEGLPPLLRTSVRVSLPDCSASSSKEEIHRAFKKTLATLMERILRESAPIAFRVDKRATPDELYISCSSPWQRVSVHEHTIREQQPFLVAKSHIVEAAKAALPKKKDDDYIAIHRSILELRVNGFPLRHPIGKRAHDLTVISLFEEMRADVHEEVVQALRETFHRNEANYHAFASVSYHAISKLFPFEKNYMVMEVAGSATTVSFVREGRLQSAEMVECGINHTESEDKSSWSNEVARMLQDASKRIPIPQTIFLATHNPHRESFVRALRSIDTLNIRFGSKAFTVIPIEDALLREHLIYGSEASPDIFLALSSLVTSPFHTQG